VISKKLLVLAMLALVISGISGCQEKNYYDVSGTGPSPINPPNTPTPTPISASKIEFRVAGNATSARVRFTNAQDGTTILTTTLPYVVTVTTNESSMFISLEATPISYPFTTVNPFMTVQIFVNGSLFREAISEDFMYSTLSVSGTWRR